MLRHEIHSERVQFPAEGLELDECVHAEQDMNVNLRSVGVWQQRFVFHAFSFHVRVFAEAKAPAAHLLNKPIHAEGPRRACIHQNAQQFTSRFPSPKLNVRQDSQP